MGSSMASVYQKLQGAGEYEVKLSDGTFKCPFCYKKKNRVYKHYWDLLQHASDAGKHGNAKPDFRCTTKLRADHLVLAKYLENEVAPVEAPMEFTSARYKVPTDNCGGEIFVFPPMVIITNIPTELRDGVCVGERGARIQEQLMRDGFNPVKVCPLWSHGNHSGNAVVMFHDTVFGFHKAVSFARGFESNHRGKVDYISNREFCGSNIHCWVARGDDYHTEDVIGKFLKKKGVLKTIDEVVARDEQQLNMDVCNLTSKFLNMEAEIKRLNEANAEEMEKVQKLLNDHVAQLESSKSKNNRLVARNEILELKERQWNGELQEARGELINALSRLDLLGDRSSVRMKNLGELDCKPFIEAAKWKFGAGEAEIKGHQLCNHWKEQLQDPNWEPFNIIQVGSNQYKAVLNEKDERLRKLKSDMGDAVLHAVQTVMMETAEFGATVTDVIPELWNFKENRKATLKEGIQKLSKEVKYVNL